MLFRGEQDLLESPHRHVQAVGERIALLRHILQTQVDGIHAQLFGKLIHHNLGRVVADGAARRAIRHRDRLIRYNVVCVHIEDGESDSAMRR